MKLIWINIVLTVVSLVTSQNITGTFFSDWQNIPRERCAPDFFVITEANNTYVATYTFTPMTVINEHCSIRTYYNGNYSANLNQTNNNTWIDTKGQQLIYDDVHDVFYFVIPDTDSYLYDRNGSYIPVEIVLSNVGATWINPTPLNSSSNETCCVPDVLFITIAPQDIWQGDISVAPSYSTNCSTNFNLTPVASPSATSLQNITWSGFGPVYSILADYILDPYNATQLTVNLNDDNNNCWYTYEKLPDHNFISGTWYLDWQSANALKVPPTYTVSVVNNSFMEGTLVFTGANQSSYVVGNVENQTQFSDSYMQLTFEFDSSLSTLLSFSTVYSPTPILYSLTGNQIPNKLADSNWTNAQVYNNMNSSFDICCVPDLISISSTPTANILNVTYTFPSDYANNSTCHSIAPYITSNNQLESTLNITTPNITLVTWNDEDYSSQISFVNTSTTSEILISNFTGTGCLFKMSNASMPKPTPLSSSWISIELKSIMMICVLILFSCV